MRKSLVTLEIIPAGDYIKTAIIVLHPTIIYIINVTIISTIITLCTVQALLYDSVKVESSHICLLGKKDLQR